VCTPREARPRPAKEDEVTLIYKPFGRLLAVFSGVLATFLFRRIWRSIRHEPHAPVSTDRDKGWAEIAAAGAMQGAIFGVTKALVDRAGAAGFAR
jgi:Protein of unknown function (DUF4235)